MTIADSALDPGEVARARALLERPLRSAPLWPALVAAIALAATSVAFATAMVLSPPAPGGHAAPGAASNP